MPPGSHSGQGGPKRVVGPGAPIRAEEQHLEGLFGAQAPDEPTQMFCVITTLRHTGAAVSSATAKKWHPGSHPDSSFPKLGVNRSPFLSRKLFAFMKGDRELLFSS